AGLWGAELFKAVAGRDFVQLEAVVHAAADRLMGETIELRAHLADFADDELFVATPAVRLRIHEGAFGVQVKAPRAEERHGRIECVAEFNHLAGLNQFCRAKNCFGFHMVAGATLIACAPFRGAALRVSGRLPRLGSDCDRCKDERRHNGAAWNEAGNGSHFDSSWVMGLGPLTRFSADSQFPSNLNISGWRGITLKHTSWQSW